MRKLAFTLVPLLFLACGREPAAPDVGITADLAAASAQWQEGTAYNPAGDVSFYAPCIDDYVDEIGTVVYRFLMVMQDDGRTLLNIYFVPGEDFVVRGVSTGDWYPVAGFHNTHVIAENVGIHDTRVLHWVVQNAATGVVLDWPIRFHYNLNANGLEILHYAEPCRVRQD